MHLGFSARRILERVGKGLLVGLSAASMGCDPGLEPKRNVLFILVDTMRVDRFGSHTGKPGITPAIDSWAQKGVVFDHAFSHAPWTLPAVGSIFTSRLPNQHGAGGRPGAFVKLSPDAVTIAEVFRDQGAKTAAITNVLFLTEGFGTLQGFGSVDSQPGGNNETLRDARGTTDAALRWLRENRDEFFFLFVHYFDAHLKYDPPQPHRRLHADPQDADTDDSLFGSMKDISLFRAGRRKIDQDLLGRLERLYNGEVAFVDDEVGRLLAVLHEMGLDENTIVVLTADHGEEFQDHGGFEHGHTLFDELLHVPLVIWEPGSSSSDHPGTKGAVDTTVRHIDLAPTLCDLAGIDSHSSFTGTSMVSLLRGEAGAHRPVLSQSLLWGKSRTAYRNEGFKLIEQPNRATRLYDVAVDPAEQRNIAVTAPERASTLREEMQLTLANSDSQTQDGEPVDLSQEQRDQLRALGYLGAPTSEELRASPGAGSAGDRAEESR